MSKWTKDNDDADWEAQIRRENNLAINVGGNPGVKGGVMVGVQDLTRVIVLDLKYKQSGEIFVNRL